MPNENRSALAARAQCGTALLPLVGTARMAGSAGARCPAAARLSGRDSDPLIGDRIGDDPARDVVRDVVANLGGGIVRRIGDNRVGYPPDNLSRAATDSQPQPLGRAAAPSGAKRSTTVWQLFGVVGTGSHSIGGGLAETLTIEAVAPAPGSGSTHLLPTEES